MLGFNDLEQLSAKANKIFLKPIAEKFKFIYR
jgi:hypothetical protein